MRSFCHDGFFLMLPTGRGDCTPRFSGTQLGNVIGNEVLTKHVIVKPFLWRAIDCFHNTTSIIYLLEPLNVGHKLSKEGHLSRRRLNVECAKKTLSTFADV